MTLYGFPYNNIFNLLAVSAVNPINSSGNVDTLFNTPYTYNPALGATGGNPNIPSNCNDATINTNFPSWISDVNSAYDLRGAYLKCSSVNSSVYVNALPNPWPTDVLNTYSPITGQLVPYTTESIFYAQSGYFVTVVLVQWSNVFACKSRKVI